MVYLIGISGFILGFLCGQMLLAHMLRERSRKEILELMNDKGKKFKYGLINWGIAAMGAISFVMAYRRYFPE